MMAHRCEQKRLLQDIVLGGDYTLFVIVCWLLRSLFHRLGCVCSVVELELYVHLVIFTLLEKNSEVDCHEAVPDVAL